MSAPLPSERIQAIKERLHFYRGVRLHDDCLELLAEVERLRKQADSWAKYQRDMWEAFAKSETGGASTPSPQDSPAPWVERVMSWDYAKGQAEVRGKYLICKGCGGTSSRDCIPACSDFGPYRFALMDSEEGARNE